VRRYSTNVILALVVVLTLALSAWLITRFAYNVATTAGVHYTASSGLAPAPMTPTPTPTARPPTPTPTSSGGSGPPSGSSSTEQQIAQAVFQAINTSRASAGLPALRWSTALAGGARKHNELMAAADQLSHQLAGEPGIGTRITQDGVNWTWCGENIGYTSNTSTGGALGLHQMMMAEQPPNDGHRQNILSVNFTMVGVDILFDSRHLLWLTEDFAN
jgi:uncharacterized protein YkwD